MPHTKTIIWSKGKAFRALLRNEAFKGAGISSPFLWYGQTVSMPDLDRTPPSPTLFRTDKAGAIIDVQNVRLAVKAHDPAKNQQRIVRWKCIHKLQVNCTGYQPSKEHVSRFRSACWYRRISRKLNRAHAAIINEDEPNSNQLFIVDRPQSVFLDFFSLAGISHICFSVVLNNIWLAAGTHSNFRIEFFLFKFRCCVDLTITSSLLNNVEVKQQCVGFFWGMFKSTKFGSGDLLPVQKRTICTFFAFNCCGRERRFSHHQERPF